MTYATEASLPPEERALVAAFLAAQHDLDDVEAERTRLSDRQSSARAARDNAQNALRKLCTNGRLRTVIAGRYGRAPTVLRISPSGEHDAIVDVSIGVEAGPD